MLFLKKRFDSIIEEMIRRGYNPKYTDSSIFTKCPPEFYNDYVPTPEAIVINKNRIKEQNYLDIKNKYVKIN